MNPVLRPIGAALAALLVGTAVVLLLVGGGTGEDGEGVSGELSSDRFELGNADEWADRVAEGGPRLFQALGEGERDLWVNHLGPTSRDGWVAFEARVPGTDRRCTLDWRPDRREFVDPCTGRRHPPDGAGLAHHPVDVVGTDVVIDLSGDPVVRPLPEA